MATSTIKMTPNVYITESGTNGIWKYHKYSDGTYWFNGNASALNGLAVRLDMYGTW